LSAAQPTSKIELEHPSKFIQVGLNFKELLGHLLTVANDMAKRTGIDESFRVVINNGAEAGQTVFHLHLHLLGNKKFVENNLSF
jgi:histidine triad (HIT) family protein